MVSEASLKTYQQRDLKEGGSHHEEQYLSANWMVFVAGAILAWISLMPIIWIGYAMIQDSLVARAGVLSVFGLLAFSWNLYHLLRLLSDLYEEESFRGDVIRKEGRTAWIFGSQVLLAITCTHLSGWYNPIGMQQWFWMPIAGFAGVILTRRSHLILVLITTLILSTAYQFAAWSLETAGFWMVGQFTTSVFIMGCCFAMTQASRQRLNTARLAAELRSANAQLELQADQAAVLAVSQERNRLAREIHDAVGHSLTVVGAQLDAAEALLDQSPARALDAIQKAQRSSREGLAEIRRSVSSLRVTTQEHPTLTESLTSLIAGAERPGLKLALQQSGKSRPLPSLVEISLYRCAQEGITNACRHAGASEITVHLDFTSDTRVVLGVTDNGRGFSKIPESSHGLKGLHERTALLHGDFSAGTDPNGGGYCRMVIPA